MLAASWLWAVFTIVAAAAQTVRNATQRSLTTSLGTVGATHVRFLFGFLGITDVEFVRAEGVAISAEHRGQAIGAAIGSIAEPLRKAA